MENSDSLLSSAAQRDARRAAHLIERIGRVLRAGDHAAGLNPAQAEALRYLARANRFSRSPAALADYLGTTRGTVSQTLLALEAKGLVERQANRRDGRSITLALTDSGRQFLAADPSHRLAVAIGAGGADAAIADALDAALRALLAERGGRAFGICRNCLHFRSKVHPDPAPHHCALLDEPLSDAEATLICAEHCEA